MVLHFFLQIVDINGMFVVAEIEVGMYLRDAGNDTFTGG
jgi:hypothetical protein